MFFLVIFVLKAVTKLINIYFMDLLKSSSKKITHIIIEKKSRNNFFGKVNKVDLDDTGFFEDDSGDRLCLWWRWMRLDWRWGAGISGGFDGDVNESEENIWGDRDWENCSCEVDLWTIDFDWKWILWVVESGFRESQLEE